MGADDGTISWTELYDGSFSGNDEINWNVDTGDLGLLSTHGDPKWHGACPKGSSDHTNCQSYEWHARLTSVMSGVTPDACWPQVTDDAMRLGDSGGETEYFDAWACGSGEIIRETDYLSEVAAGLHQWHGFAGSTANGTGTSSTIDDYIDDAFDGSAAYAWLTNETAFDFFNSGPFADVCAVPFVWGTSFTDSDTRMDNEKYGSGSYSDANTTYVTSIYYADCDPADALEYAMKYW
jgi:hypothetical protein